MANLRLADQVRQRTLQAEGYRCDRVLLAGDAAHIHMPLGGRGMNLGLADAGDLAWKVAAMIHGWASPELMDSYAPSDGVAGRRGHQGADRLGDGDHPDGKALRARFNEMLADHPSVNRELAERLPSWTWRSRHQRTGIHW